MNRLHKDVESEKGPEGKEKGNAGEEKRKGAFSKWLLAPAAVAVLALSAHGCGDQTLDNYVPIPPANQDAGPDVDADSDMDATDTDTGPDSDTGPDADTDADAGCEAPTPICTPQTVSALLNAGSAALSVGDFHVDLEGTNESLTEQRAVVDLQDICDVPVAGGDDVTINEDATVTIVAVPGKIEVDIKAEQVTIGDQGARITATMRCIEEETDGGVTDAGADADADMDADTDMDAGTDADTDMDGGLDADVDVDADVDADTDVDAGTTDGGVTDGGVDTDAGLCAEAFEDAFNSVINDAVPVTVGALTVDYNGGTDATGMVLSITCGADTVANQVFPVGVMATFPLAGGLVVDVTPNHCAPTWGHVTVDVHSP